MSICWSLYPTQWNDLPWPTPTSRPHGWNWPNTIRTVAGVTITTTITTIIITIIIATATGTGQTAITGLAAGGCYAPNITTTTTTIITITIRTGIDNLPGRLAPTGRFLGK